ncbi:MAG TPA: hypothetical protein VFJ16_14090 [Longimicrobium sp.]|nr:hypothetical protein [Longimicrobium sp.]
MNATPARMLPVIACLLSGCAPAAPRANLAAPVPYTTLQGPYTERVREIIRAHQPRLLDQPAGHAQYLYVLGDGSGRVVRTMAEDVAPTQMGLPTAALGRIATETEVEGWMAMSDPAWGVMGMSLHLPGEVGPDSVWVFWAEPPVHFGQARAAGGPLPFGLAAAEQTTPRLVHALARHLPRGRSLWYVYDDQERVLAYGTWPGADPDVEAGRNQLRPRFAGGALTCAMAQSIRGAGGRLVRVVPVRFQPADPAVAR